MVHRIIQVSEIFSMISPGLWIQILIGSGFRSLDLDPTGKKIKKKCIFLQNL
jgi:hypothetical protein